MKYINRFFAIPIGDRNNNYFDVSTSHPQNTDAPRHLDNMSAREKKRFLKIAVEQDKFNAQLRKDVTVAVVTGLLVTAVHHYYKNKKNE